MNTLLYPLFGTLFTFLMTTLGSALVFFFKDEVKSFYQQLFLGFAAGIMIAASVWSLLIPSMEMAEANGQNSALILGGGFIIGALFLLFLEYSHISNYGHYSCSFAYPDTVYLLHHIHCTDKHLCMHMSHP